MNESNSISDLTHSFSQAWLNQACVDLDGNATALIQKASKQIQPSITGKHASTGEPLLDHVAGLVLILRDMGLDAATRAAALLSMQYTPDGELAKNDPIRNEFGTEIATMVQGVRALLRLSHIADANSENQPMASADQEEMQRKMLLAMAADLRIVLIRLASRLQSLRWYAASKTPCPVSFARETMRLYTPLANRLGIWQIKWEMEDLSFRFLEPDTYKKIAKQLEEKRHEREDFIKK